MASDEGALSGYVPEQWPGEVRDALDDWAFGYLTPVPPFMWAQYTGLDPVLLTEVDGNAEQQADPSGADPGLGTGGDLEDERRERWSWQSVGPTPDLIVADGDWACEEGSQVVGGLVVSQTCDVGGKGPGGRHVTVQVSPVVRVDSLNRERRELMEKWRIVDRALLEPPDSEGTFVADLRLSVPLSKGALARVEPVPAFPDEPRMLMLAEHVATKIRRPALHDFLAETVRAAIQQEIKNAKGDSLWWSPVEEILVSTTPDRLKPTHAQLLVISRQPLSLKAKQRWHDLIDRLLKRGMKVDIVMQAPIFSTAKSLRADVYRRAVKLHIPELRSPY